MNQDDFRRLLATPQPIKKSNNKFKVPKKENSYSKNDNPKPKPKKRWKKPVNEEEDKHYRDRAKERRQEMNPDYEETKAIFSMLNKNRDDEAKAYVEQIHGDNQKPTFNSILAKNIHYWAVEKPKEQLPLKNEMFIAGRMAFVWELGLENGFYVGSSDIPITLQRSKAEIKNYQDKFDVSTNDLVIDKISQIMVNVRLGIRNVQNPTMQEKKKIKKKEKEKTKKIKKLENPPEDYEDIFDDVGVDYKLDFDKKNTEDKNDKKGNTNVKNYFESTENSEDENDDENKSRDLNNKELFKGSKLLEKLMTNKYDEKNKDKNAKSNENNINEKNDKKKEKNDFEMDLDALDEKFEEKKDKEKLDTWQSDADVGPSRPPQYEFDGNKLNTWQSDADIGPSRPPEFGDEDNQLNIWQSNVDIGPPRPPVYSDDVDIETQNYEDYKNKSNVPNKIKPLSKERDNDLDYSDSDDDDEDDGYSQMDLGTNRNKQRQLKRWDFDTEEEWKQYKDNSVIIPKAAFQYGVKSSEGRQLKSHHKSDTKSKDEKLNRELKQIEKIMDDKYRKSKSEERKRDDDHSSSSRSHSSHHHSSSKRHSRSRWEDDDDDDRHSKRNRH
ncbi:hypothetical protein PIROE2DRAFT_68910 [Piromyces sp. E2]|nr:hypothetical protein PIROE2DRAFT_68910 [Piromyces sp. E2]|eukprot:OUM66733.1 hypothetical protein PIROE2DRAFT_68910 [Piromyces sp. E2]